MKKLANGTAPESCTLEGCNLPYHAAGFCGVHYGRNRNHGNPLAGQAMRCLGTIAERLAFYGEQQASGCIHWTGSITANGYGYLGLNGKRVVAHRLAYEHHVGPIPDGLHLDHVCHNRDLDCPGGWGCLHRRCINPEHLEPVTQAENNRRAHRRVVRAEFCAIEGCGNRRHSRGVCSTHYQHWRKGLLMLTEAVA